MLTPTTFARRASMITALFLTASLSATVARAADWPQYRGPHSDQHTDEAVRTDWNQNPPKVLWKVPLGESFGSFAVKGDRAYVFMKDGEQESCVAFDAANGKEIWRIKAGRTIFPERQGGEGPRSTPTVDGDKVYLFGTFFQLTCLNAADGKIVWAHDLAKEFDGQTGTNGINPWGQAASPIVEGDLVILAGGGPNQTFMAFDKNTGKVAWKTGTEKVTHATPTPATIHGQRQVIFFVMSGLVSLNPKDGKELWRYNFPWNVSTAASPVVGGKDGDVVYCAAGYNVGAGAARISNDGGKWTAKELYRLKGNKNANHWSTPVHHDGYVYGLYGHNNRGTAPLECRDIETGEVKWSQEGFGTGGGLIVAGNTLIVQKDSGPITIIEPNPAGYKQLGEASPLQLKRGGKAWTMPVVANGRMYVRTDTEGACVEVAKQAAARAE